MTADSGHLPEVPVYTMTYLLRGRWLVECTMCDWWVQEESVARAHDTAVRHVRRDHS